MPHFTRPLAPRLPRPLPSRPDPVPGQSLPSYLETLAATAALPVPLITVMYRTGLIDAEAVDAIGPAYGIALDEDRLRTFAFVTRLDEDQVRGMLLSTYDGIAVDFSRLDPNDPNSVRQASLDNWGFFTTTWLCPLCVRVAPVLMVSCRLPLHFACLHHGVLHADTCPSCAKHFGHIRKGHGGTPLFASHVPQPGHCWNAPPVGACGAGHTATPCGYDLATVPTFDLTPYPRVLNAQRVILDVLDRRVGRVAGRERPALEYVSHLRSVVALLAYGGRVEDLGEIAPPSRAAAEAYVEDRDARLRERQALRVHQGRGGPTIAAHRGTQRSAALMAGLLPAAVELLGVDTVEDLADRLAPLVERARDVKKMKLRLLGTDFRFEGVLAEAFDRTLAPKADFNRRIGRHSRFTQPGGYTFKPEHVPQLLWADVFEERVKPLLGGSNIGDDYARRVGSMCLVKLIGEYSWVEAAERLDLPAGSGTGSANKVMGVLNALGTNDAFAAVLHDIAATLSARTDKVDYAALRRRLDDFSEVPYDIWLDLTRDTLCHPGHRGGKHRLAAATVWAHATEGDWRLAPALQDERLSTDTHRELYRRFQRDDLPHVRAALEDLARHLTTRDLG